MLLLNNVLHLTEEEIRNSKIEFNMHAGGKSFLDVWLSATDDKKSAGLCSNCSYWGWYGKQRNFFPGQWVFSFVRIREDEWLFVSAGEVLDVPANTWAKVEILERFVPLFGRLIIRCKKNNTYSRYTLLLQRYIEQAEVKEILPGLYSGEEFMGYENVHLSYPRLQGMLGGKILPTYREALSKICGVYCLTDTHTGKLYIGSATGSDGVVQRWGDYLRTMHGGNVKLRRLYKEKGSEYFEKYFTFTLLEYFSLSCDPEAVIAREQHWKRCLDTIRNGYNDN